MGFEKVHENKIERTVRKLGNKLSEVILSTAGDDGVIDKGQLNSLKREIKYLTGWYAEEERSLIREGITESARLAMKGQDKAALTHMRQVIDKYEDQTEIVALLEKALGDPNPMLLTATYGEGLPDYIADEVWKARWSDGKNLSDRIWDHQALADYNVQAMVQYGVNNGKSAVNISRAVEQYLLEYGSLWRTDIQPAKTDRATVLYNALRLARTENNQAYHSAQHISAKNSELVKGVKWNVSLSHPTDWPPSAAYEGYPEICDYRAENDHADLGPGVYQAGGDIPFDHPNGLCYLTDVLYTDGELMQILSEKYGIILSEEVNIVPEQKVNVKLSAKEAREIRDNFYKYVDEADMPDQCHYMVAKLREKFGDIPGVEYIQWDESKWQEVADILKRDKAWKGWLTDDTVRELLQDISDFSVNGHSFIKVGNEFIDPYLYSLGVNKSEIKRFGKYYYEVLDEISDKRKEKAAKILTKFYKALGKTDYSKEDRIKIAEKFSKQLDFRVYTFSEKNSSDFGSNRFMWSDAKQLHESELRVRHFNLGLNDTRPDDNRNKTIFHELYHSALTGTNFNKHHFYNYGGEWDGWFLDIEEVQAETAGHYLASLTGIGDLQPSYTSRLVNILPKLKTMDKYSDAETFADFGKKFVEERVGLKTHNHNLLMEVASNAKFYTEKYDYNKYVKDNYLEYIKENKEKIVDSIFSNQKNRGVGVRDEIGRQLDESIAGESYGNRVMTDALAAAMRFTGVKSYETARVVDE